MLETVMLVHRIDAQSCSQGERTSGAVYAVASWIAVGGKEKSRPPLPMGAEDSLRGALSTQRLQMRPLCGQGGNVDQAW